MSRFIYVYHTDIKVDVASKDPVQSAPQLSLSCFLLMPLTESFYIYFCEFY